MTIYDLGYTENLERFKREQNLDSFETGRVISEHKDRYVVKTGTNEFDAEPIGSLRFTAESRHDLPAVGDWVAFSEYDEGKALIHTVYPRHSIIERQAVGKSSQKQIIATNIDYGLIIQSGNRDFNINRLERYLTICNASRVEPVIILSKIDLMDESTLKALLGKIKERVKGVQIFPISSQSGIGLDELSTIIKKGKTYCLLGSSGVGKSTLLNALSGKELMDTGAISESIDRGKHVTSHRELIVLNNGGILIDNPGMREVGITDLAEGLETTFETIIEYSGDCKFKDCTHIHENGCAILEAVERGEIDRDSYANYRKMLKEKQHFESSALERKKKDKDLGKLIKNMKKQRKNDRF